MKKLIDEIHLISRNLPPEKIELKFFIEKLTQIGTPILFMILALPFIFPIPIPGLSVVFGLLIFSIGIGYLFGIKIRLPSSIQEKKISSLHVKKILNTSIIFLKKIEPFRFSFLDRILENIKWIDKFIVIIITFSAFILLLPLPPGTNFPSAITIVILSIGLIQKNYLILGLGILIFISKIYILNYFSHNILNILN